VPYDEVMLIRCPPGAAGSDAVLAHLDARADGRLLMFFHGPGMAWASAVGWQRELAAKKDTVTLMLCAAGWRRRQAGLPPAGWQLGSLVQFWDAADRAAEVTTFGALGD